MVHLGTNSFDLPRLMCAILPAPAIVMRTRE